jgi:hypothetical protein
MRSIAGICLFSRVFAIFTKVVLIIVECSDKVETWKLVCTLNVARKDVDSGNGKKLGTF